MVSACFEFKGLFQGEIASSKAASSLEDLDHCSELMLTHICKKLSKADSLL